MIFINDTNFDVLVSVLTQKFVVPRKSKHYFNESIGEFCVAAVPCKKSKTKLKIPFAGINTFGSEHLACEIVCSCSFMVKNVLPSSTVRFCESKTDSVGGVKYISLFVKGEYLDVSEVNFKTTDSTKAKRKYKFLLLFVVYGLILWLCGTVFGFAKQEYIVAVIGIVATVLSLVFYKINTNNFNESVTDYAAHEELIQKQTEMAEDEEILSMFDEIEATKTNTKAEKFAVRVAKHIYKKIM